MQPSHTLNEIRPRPIFGPGKKLIAYISERKNGEPVRHIATGRQHRPVGSYCSTKNGRRVIWESYLELYGFYHAEVLWEVVSYRAQPHTLELPIDGVWHSYTPDREDRMADSGIEIIEIKDEFKPLRDPLYTQKLQHAAAVYTGLGLKYRIVERQQLQAQPLFKAVKEIQCYGPTVVTASDLQTVGCLFKDVDVRPLRDVQASFKNNVTGTHKAYAMVVRRHLTFDLGYGLNDNTPVRFPGIKEDHMRERINLTVGQKVTIDDIEYEFLNAVRFKSSDKDASDDLQFRESSNHAIERLTNSEFVQLVNSGRVVLPTKGDIGNHEAPEEPCAAGEICPSCSQCKERKMRANRLFLTQAFDEAPVSKTDKSLQNFIDALKPSIPHPGVKIPKAAVLRRLLRERGDPGDRRPRQMADRRRFGAGRSLLHPVAQQVVWDKAERYWNSFSHSAKDVYAEVKTELGKRNKELAEQGLKEIPIPCRQTIWRMLTQHTNFNNARRRFGAKKAEKMFTAHKGSLKTDKILDIAIIDHTVLDCFVVDDQNFMTIGRPYLTVMMDVRSRYPLGFLLGFTPPSLQSTMGCIRRGVRSKTDLHEKYPGSKKWLAYGAPRSILVDNGWDFAGSSFMDACQDAGISIIWAPVARPQYKGIGERFFGTLKTQLVRKLPGGIPLKPHELEEYGLDPQATAGLLLSEVEELIYDYIVNVYSTNEHSGIKDIPERVWMERAPKDGIRIPSDLRALDNGLAKLVGSRRLSRKGIEFKNLVYCSSEVSALLNDLLPLAKKRNHNDESVEVKVKYWPEDLFKVAVWNDVRREYVELPCTQPEYASGLSEYRHDLISKLMREKTTAHITEAERCANLAELNDKIASLANNRRIGMRKRIERAKPWPNSSHDMSDFAGTNLAEHETLIDTLSVRNDGGAAPIMPARGGKAAKRKRTASRGVHLAADQVFSPTQAVALERIDMRAKLEAARREYSQ